MTTLLDMLVLLLCGLAVFLVWSVMAIVATVALLIVPAIMGLWRTVRLLSVSLLLVLAGLWISAWFGAYPDLPLPSRPKAAVVLLPIVAIWPALAARFAHLRCHAMRAG